jgi:hypothetical protein
MTQAIGAALVLAGVWLAKEGGRKADRPAIPGERV